MLVNPKKCKEAYCPFLLPFWAFSSRSVAVTGNALETIKAHKVLGVTIQSNPKWDESHVNEIVGKASKRLHILRVLEHSGAPPHDLLRVYIALIRSVLEYCCPGWHSSLSLCPALRKNRESAKTQISYNLSCLLLQRRIEAVCLHDSVWQQDFLCAKSFENIKDPGSRLHHLMPLTRAREHGCSLRFNDRPSLMKCKTERFKKSFFPHMCFKAHGLDGYFPTLSIICGELFIISKL